MAADDWPRCYGRYATLADAERAKAFQTDGPLRWLVVPSPGAGFLWELRARPYSMTYDAGGRDASKSNRDP